MSAPERPPARLPVRQPDEDPRLPPLMAKGLTGPDGEVINIFGTLAHHPDLLRRWLVFASHILNKNSLPDRERELLILRTGANCRSPYEWGQHVLVARDCGISDDEIARVLEGPQHPDWSEADRELLRAADELHRRSTLTDDIWAALTARWTTEQVLDVIATVGNYHFVAMFLNATRVELDAGVPDQQFPGDDTGDHGR